MSNVGRFFDDDEWHDSYTAVRDLPFGEIVFWLDSLQDIAVDEKSTQAERRAAQKAYDFASVTATAMRQLQDIMRAEVRAYPDDEDEEQEAQLPPLRAYIERVSLQHPHLNKGMTTGLAVQARNRGKRIEDMPLPSQPRKKGG